jgi:hypothetical protein
MRSVPEQAGHLFLTSGWQGSPHPANQLFYRSTDGGSTWSSVGNIKEVWSCGFGKAAPGKSYPAIYIVGWVSLDGGATYSYGIWRAIDGDQAKPTWTKIGDGFPVGSFDSIKVIEGDGNTYGTVYVGTGGNGWYYGELNYLLKRDLRHNDSNSPTWVNKAA